jgi:hypothetical protein
MSDFNDTASNVHSAIIAVFKREGIGLPDPDRRAIEQRMVRSGLHPLIPTRP